MFNFFVAFAPYVCVTCSTNAFILMDGDKCSNKHTKGGTELGLKKNGLIATCKRGEGGSIRERFCLATGHQRSLITNCFQW